MTSDKAASAAGISLSKLSAVSAGETPFEFEYLINDVTPSGIFFRVLGAQCERVQSVINAEMNARNRSRVAAEAAAAKSGEIYVLPIEEMEATGHKLTAARLVGWRRVGETDGLDDLQLKRFQGIEEEYSPENALTIVRSNPDIAQQVVRHSNGLGNFMKVSSRA